MESVLYWPTTLSMRSALQCDLYAQCYSLEKSLFLLSKSYQLGMASWLGWDFMSPLPLHAGVLSDLSLCGSYECCRCPCDFKGDLLSLENAVS